MLKSGKCIVLSVAVHLFPVLIFLLLNILIPEKEMPVIVDMRMVHLEEPAEKKSETPITGYARKAVCNRKHIINKEITETQEKNDAPKDVVNIDTLVSRISTDSVGSSHETIPDDKTDGGLSEIKKIASRTDEEYGYGKDTEVINFTEKEKVKNNGFSYIASIIAGHSGYPEAAEEMEISGTVILEFIVKKDGNLNGVKVSRSSGYDILDNDAVRTVKISAPFPSPGVNIKILFPMEYVLNTID